MSERENYVELFDDAGTGDKARRVKRVHVNGKPVTVAPGGIDLCMIGNSPQITLTIRPSELTFTKEN